MKQLLTIMQVANEVSEHAGVQLGEKQKDMVVSRLKRRMQSLNLNSDEEYIAYYVENRQEEFKHLLSILTTHHTFFFREFKQFEHLRDVVLPKVIPVVRSRTNKTLRVWSAACSRGQEVYSLAIFLEMVLKEIAPDIRIEVVGTDVDGISVDFARNGVFLKKELDPVPVIFQSGNFLKGSAGLEEFVKVHPRIHSMCSFDKGNLSDTSTWPKGSFDVIFCRNVFIYFSAADIARVAEGMKTRLDKNGSLFLGLTESLNGVSTALAPVGPSVYGRKEEWAHKSEKTEKATLKPVAAQAGVTQVRRVLCVDDSPTVLKILAEIFNKQSGYNIVHTAGNGKEAAKLLDTNKYDLITLDIHMPEMTGLEFMQKAYRPNHPPVIVVSSVDRTDDKLALEMMRLGAKDYIQKPTLKDFAKYRDEFLLKADTVCAHRNQSTANSVDKLFATKTSAQAAGRIGVFFCPTDWRRALDFVQLNRGPGIVFELIYFDKPGIDKNWIDRFNLVRESLGSIHRQASSVSMVSVPKLQVAAVLSSFDRNQLSIFKQMKGSTYLAEEAYAHVDRNLLEDFDLFPAASLGYMIKKTLLEAQKKGA